MVTTFTAILALISPGVTNRLPVTVDQVELNRTWKPGATRKEDKITLTQLIFWRVDETGLRHAANFAVVNEEDVEVFPMCNVYLVTWHAKAPHKNFPKRRVYAMSYIETDTYFDPEVKDKERTPVSQRKLYFGEEPFSLSPVVQEQ